MNPAALQIYPGDSVATALRDLAAGETVLGVTLLDAVPRAHKLAIRAHMAGDPVVKYGFPIGRATAAIAPGAHVHVHNVATALAGEAAYDSGAAMAARAVAPSPLRWRGYTRADGRAGTRNEIWVLPTVGCVGRTAQKIAAKSASGSSSSTSSARSSSPLRVPSPDPAQP